MMKVPNKQHLLTELDNVGHSERVRRMALLGRDAAGTAELNELLNELQRGDTYEQMLCLFAGIAARDDSRILTALQSDSVLLRKYAAAACWAVTDDNALAAVILKAAPETRQRLMRKIAKKRRTALAEQLFPQIRANFGVELAVLLLPACTPATVERVLAEDNHAIRHWQRLAWLYPDIVFHHIQQTFATAPRRTHRTLWLHFDSAWKTLTSQRPEKVLELVQAFAEVSADSPRYQHHNWFSRAFNNDSFGIPAQVLEIITKLRPNGLFKFLTRADCRKVLRNNGLPWAVQKHFRLFSPEQQVTLLQQLLDEPAYIAKALEQLPPSVRAARFTAAYKDRDTQHTVWPTSLLDVLPHAKRAQLAQQQLTRREIREEPQRQLEMTAYDDIDNARPILEQAATAALADERAQALTRLVRCTARYRRGLTETLSFLQRLKNEQEPVRNAAWNALADVPPRLFQTAQIALLRPLIDFTLEARDTSTSTHSAIEKWAFALLQTNATELKGELFRFSLETLRKLAQQSGSLHLLPSFIGKNLPRGMENALVEALLPLIRAFEEREQYSLLLKLAHTLGKRAWNVTVLQELLATVINAKPEYLAKHAINLWLADPKTRDVRIRQLLDQDASIISIPEVFQHLHHRRQEWLDPFLTGEPIKGRFLTGKTFYLLPAQNGFHRWLPRQQQTFTKWQQLVANDDKREASQRVQAIHTLARIPTSNTATFTPYLDSEEVVINEAALGALSWIDRPHAALPIFLQNMEGDRARVAMYAVPRCARLVEPNTLVEVLKTLLARNNLRVTVHKEAIRLLGTFATPSSIQLLRTQWQRPSIHRDVQIAIGHAARNLLNHEEAWELLEKLAQTDDIYIARSLFAQQATTLPPAARVRYAKLLLKMTTHTDVRVRREVFMALKTWTVGAEAEMTAAAVTRMIDLDNSPEWDAVLDVLVTCCRDGQETERLHQIAQTLIKVPVTDSINAMPERDLPARQRLLRLCQRLCQLPEANRLLLRPHLDTLASIYLQDSSLWPQATLLQVAGLAWKTPNQCAEPLRQLAQQAEKEPIWVQALRKAVRDSLQRGESPEETTPALELIDTLIADQTNTSALLALEILRYVGSRSHWPVECAQRLRTLREYPNVGVRHVARNTWTNQES